MQAMPDRTIKRENQLPDTFRRPQDTQDAVKFDFGAIEILHVVKKGHLCIQKGHFIVKKVSKGTGSLCQGISIALKSNLTAFHVFLGAESI